MSEQERLEIVCAIAENPSLGKIMPGTGGARKARFAMPGKGKRGSYRTVHFFSGIDVPILMLAVVKKGDRADLSQAEKNELRKELAGFANDYRASTRGRATGFQRRPR